MILHGEGRLLTLAGFLHLAINSPFHVKRPQFWLFHDKLLMIHSLTPYFTVIKYLFRKFKKNTRNFPFQKTFSLILKKSLKEEEIILHLK